MTSTEHTPAVLLIEDQEWTARSIESILRPSGLAVVHAYTGRQGVDITRQIEPDLVLVDLHLPDMTGVEVIEKLHESNRIRPSTPIALTSTGHVPQPERLRALEAGAWEVFQAPFDSLELILRVRTWLRAKRDADVARESGLVDFPTGLYNFNGLMRRVDEMVAESTRHESHIACVVIGPSTVGERTNGDEEGEGPDWERLARAMKGTCRLSDAIGRLRSEEFAIVASSTDAEGATRLAERILQSLRETEQFQATVDMKAGVYAVKRSKEDATASVDILSRATSALRHAQTEENEYTVRFEELGKPGSSAS